MTTEQLAQRMSLKAGQAAFLADRLAIGRCFIMTRTVARPCRHWIAQGRGGNEQRTIQSASETLEAAMKTFNGWPDYRPILYHVTNGEIKVVAAYHRKAK